MRSYFDLAEDATKLWQAGGSVSNHLPNVTEALEEILDRREAPLCAEIERLMAEVSGLKENLNEH